MESPKTAAPQTPAITPGATDSNTGTLLWCCVCCEPITGCEGGDVRNQAWVTTCGHVVCGAHVVGNGGRCSSAPVTGFLTTSLV